MHNTRILENMKSFGYQIPKDPEKLLYDFYFMVGFIHRDREDKVLDFVFKEAVRDCVDALHKHMTAALLWSLSCESRHAETETDFPDYVDILVEDREEDIFFKFFRNHLNDHPEASIYLPFWMDYVTVLLNNDGEPASAKPINKRIKAFKILLSLKKKHKFTSKDLAKGFIYLFRSFEWYPGYGGDSWADIADAYLHLLEAKTLADKIVWIDHAYDLQHNNGTVFSKVTSYDKEGFSWLRRALFWKKNIKDLRGFYDRVSGSLRPVVAWVAKNEHGLTIEGYESADIAKGDLVSVKPSQVEDYKREGAFWGWTDLILEPKYFKIVKILTDNPDDFEAADPDVVSILICDPNDKAFSKTIHEIPASYFEKDKRKAPLLVKKLQAEILAENM